MSVEKEDSVLKIENRSKSVGLGELKMGYRHL